MNVLSGLASLVVFAFFVWWLQNNDRMVHGAPTTRDRIRTILCAACGLLMSLGFAYWGALQYGMVTISLAVLYQALGVGIGKRGNYRQIRDGIFLGWVAGLPITISWLSDHAGR